MTRGHMRWRTPRSAFVVAIVGGVLALQLGTPRPEPPVADAVVVAADGDLDLQSSLDGMPILSASGLGPGDTASGLVTVTNAGTGSGQFSLKRQLLSDSPGPGGGALSNRLELVVSDVTVPIAPTAVYSGPLGAMPEKALGTLGPGQVRIYRFEASLPEGGGADNAFAGAATSVGYRWTVSSGSSEPPVDPPVDPPVGPPGNPPANPPAGPATPPGGGAGGPSDGGSLPNFMQSRLRLAIKLPKAQRVKRTGIIVRVRCTQACVIATRGRVGVQRAKRPLGMTRLARKKGKPGGWVKITLKLSKKTLAKMTLAKAQRKKVSLKVTVNARTAKGQKAKAAKAGKIR